MSVIIFCREMLYSHEPSDCDAVGEFSGMQQYLISSAMD